MNEMKKFYKDRETCINGYRNNDDLKNLSEDWRELSMQNKYVYNFDWFGRPIIQYPQDMIALQEIIWNTKPDLIIETGIAHGGSLIFSASMLALLDLAESNSSKGVMNEHKSKRLVIGIDIDIRDHNRKAIEDHPFSDRIEMLEGSSIDTEIIKKVLERAKKFKRIMLCLDSLHTHDHVLAELEAYSRLVTPGCYCIVLDTFIEDLPDSFFKDRPWNKGNNSKTALKQFLDNNKRFEIDHNIYQKLLISVAPDGFLKCIKE